MKKFVIICIGYLGGVIVKQIILATIFIILFTFADTVYADQYHTSSVNFKRIEISDGLSQGTVQDIVQDSDGYMWFATEDGLNKYDGIDFEFYRYSEDPKRLLNLINNIIDTSKIESGEYKINLEEHDIVYHIEATVFDMKDFIESKGIEFIIDPNVEELMIKCDINDIEKCIINIIGNAVKFTDEAGKIEVLIDDVYDNVEIRIKDTGIGIDEKDLEGIFNRFGQAYNKKSEEFGGSGIGLTLTKQLIELHNGELLVESKVGVGSTFIIILPKQ